MDVRASFMLALDSISVADSAIWLFFSVEGREIISEGLVMNELVIHKYLVCILSYYFRFLPGREST